MLKHHSSRRSFLKRSGTLATIGAAPHAAFAIHQRPTFVGEVVGQGDFTYRVDKHWGIQDPGKSCIRDLDNMLNWKHCWELHAHHNFAEWGNVYCFQWNFIISVIPDLNRLVYICFQQQMGAEFQNYKKDQENISIHSVHIICYCVFEGILHI